MKRDVMKVRKVHIVAASLCFLVQPLLAQTVKLAKIALGMNDTEVKRRYSGPTSRWRRRRTRFADDKAVPQSFEPLGARSASV